LSQNDFNIANQNNYGDVSGQDDLAASQALLLAQMQVNESVALGLEVQSSAIF